MDNKPTEKDEKNKSESKDYPIGLIFGILFIAIGLAWVIKGFYGVGISSWTMKYTATGGELFIFVGLIFLYVSYHSISPYSKYRKFFEGRKKRKNGNREE